MRARVVAGLTALPMVLGFTSQSTAADARDWSLVGTFEEGNATMALDLASLQISGPRRVIWSRIDRAKPYEWQGALIMSSVAQIEVNCANRQQRIRYEIGYHPDQKVAYQFDAPRAWTPIVPDTVGEGRFNAICKSAAQHGRKGQREGR